MEMSGQKNGKYTLVEVCAGAGGQALGLEAAGFDHVALVEIDAHACQTLRNNRPAWNVIEADIKDVRGNKWGDVDLLAGGVPCPPFSIAGKQRGAEDERDLFPEMLRLVKECNPRGVMIENVKGLLGKRFDEYRSTILKRLRRMGYVGEWKLVNACDFGVPQLRPRSILVALRKEDAIHWSWPEGDPKSSQTVGEILYTSMSANGWPGAKNWASMANTIAPTLVGGSRKHGGADLGPTRAKTAWAELGVDGIGLADELPNRTFRGVPRLTVAQTALLQGFPEEWLIQGRKTAAYRQVGNAFPPPVAKAIGESFVNTWKQADSARQFAAGLQNEQPNNFARAL